jgi:hypothetical protein
VARFIFLTIAVWKSESDYLKISPSFIDNGRAKLRRSDVWDWFPIQKYPLPQLEIQQAPDAIPIVVIPGRVLVEESPYGTSAEEPAFQCSRFRQQFPKMIQGRAGKPVGPGRGKAHFLPMHD